MPAIQEQTRTPRAAHEKRCKVVGVSLHTDQVETLERTTQSLRRARYPKASRSFVMQALLQRLKEDLEAKSTEEIVRYFMPRDLRTADAVPATGLPITEAIVSDKVRQAGTVSPMALARRHARRLILQGLKDGSQHSEILRQLNDQTGAELGAWTPSRLVDVVRHLLGPLMARKGLLDTFPAEQEKHRVLKAVE
jgi:hypothetical protein